MTSRPETEAAAVIADLKHRLAIAEETLHAIREGSVDALVVRGNIEDEVFTIGNDPESYRIFMEAMDPGAAALDGGGMVLYANQTLCGILGRQLGEIQGKPLAVLFNATAAAEISKLVGHAGDGKHSAEIRLDGPGDNGMVFIVSATPMRLGTVRGHAVTFTDVTQRVRAEAAERSERAARAIIASANEAVLVCDRSGIITHANAATGIVYDGDPVGKRFADIIPLVFPGATGLVRANEMIEMAVAGNAVRGIEARAPQAPSVKDYLISAAPLQLTDGQSSGCVVTMVDLSHRKAAEKQQLILMSELDHRVKNTLALVMSISARTLSNEDTIEGFQQSFTGRIQALAATHTLLADRSWANLSLRDIVLAEMLPFIGANSTRVETEGLETMLAPRAAIALGLVVHELATNAVKYGALSGEAGRIRVRSLGASGPEKPLRLEWRERGGPAVNLPRRSGFGRTVIARSLAYSPQGGAELDFHPAGVVCTISVPGEDLR